MRGIVGLFAVSLVAICVAGGADANMTREAAAEVKLDVESDARALAPFRAYVGGWRGTGVVGAGSSKAAVPVECHWAWQFRPGFAHAQLRADLSGTRTLFYSMLELEPGSKPGQFVLVATIDQGPGVDGELTPHRFAGVIEKNGTLVLAAEHHVEDYYPNLISLRVEAKGDRMLIAYERRLSAGGLRRLAEVSLEREGVPFAKAVASGKECVVTGGPGTIAVSYQGKTYDVCCAACRDYFREHPEATLAALKKRKGEGP